MTKQILPADTRLVWAFGRPYQFCWVSSSNQRIGPEDFEGTPAHPARFQKTQIMLHATGGNIRAENEFAGWRKGTDSAGRLNESAAHAVVERTPAGTRGNPVNHRAARPAVPPGVLSDGTDRFVDAVRVIISDPPAPQDFDLRVFHGSSANTNAIGIEHENAAHKVWSEDAALEPTRDPATKLPRDLNRWIQGIGVGDRTNSSEFQAYEDEQYNTMILMYRSLCIEFRIPRAFLGASWKERSRNYVRQFPASISAEEVRERRLSFFRFRGFVQHTNAAADSRTCPGVVGYNRLFRGITDEWWMPLELLGLERRYYSGPFWHPTFEPPDNSGKPTKPGWFRWLGGIPPTVEPTLYRDVDVDALVETRSYFDLNDVPHYFAASESALGGTFPIGSNRVWHGGVHLEADPGNPVVYAAASGIIVAARLTSHADTDVHPDFGSQRFLLIRHAVYWRTEPDPDGPPSSGPGDPAPERINYGPDPAVPGSPPHPVNPTFVFSLYMHLEAVSDLHTEADENPRWYNQWLREQARAENEDPDKPLSKAQIDAHAGMTDDGGRGRVFNPDIEVSVGDVLGTAGFFAGRRMIHFEVVSHPDREVSAAGGQREVDDDDNRFADSAAIDRLLEANGQKPLDQLSDPLDAAASLRNARVRHLSEWGLRKEHVTSCLVGTKDVCLVEMGEFEDWPHMERFMWVDDALAVHPDLTTQLGSTGIFWHYHPITFMEAINRLIQSENRELKETHFEDETNVELDENGFLTDYFDFDGATSTWNPANADGERVVPYDVQKDGAFDFTRADLACRPSVATPPPAHIPPVDPPQRTFVSLALAEILQRVRVRFNRPLFVDLAHVCEGHLAEVDRCCRHDPASHHAGLAVDFHPDPASGSLSTQQTRVAELWAKLKAICDEQNDTWAENAGSPHSSAPIGITGVIFFAQDDTVTDKLNADPIEALTAIEIQAFRIHMELVE